MTVAVLTAQRCATMAKNKVTGFSGWSGYDDHLQIGGISNWKWRCVVKFPLWEIPAGSVINSVVLRLTYYSTANPHTVGSSSTGIQINRMTADWGKGTTNPGEGNFAAGQEWHWDNRYNKWSTPMAAKTITQGAGQATEDITVTNIFMDWWEGGKANYGIILMNTEESNENKALLFFSSETATVGLHPELIVDYTANTPPLAPKNLLPDNNATVNSLTPTFSGELDDVDVDDTISAWVMRVQDSETRAVWSDGVVPVVEATRTISIVYGSSNRYDSLQPLQSGETYSWRMALCDSAGNWSPYSAYRYFTVNAAPNAPTVTLTPGPLNAVPDSTPNVSIQHNKPDSSDTLMDGYGLVVEKETSLGSADWTVVYDSGDVDVSSAPVAVVNTVTPVLVWGGSYRLKARTQDSLGAWSSYSPALPFVLLRTSVPTSLNPTGSVVTTTAPVLSGTRGSSNDIITAFSLRVYSDDQTSTMLSETRYTTGTDGASFSKLYAGAALIAGQAYRWQAQVESTIGGTSEWSALQRFVINNDALVPTITSPVGDNDYTLTPTVAMNRAANFDRVQYEVYPDSSTEAVLGTAHFASGTITKTLNTTYSATYAGTALEWDTGYKIRARVSPDGGSTWANWSGLYWFKTDSAAGPPILTSVGGEAGDPAWITDSTPEFVIGENAAETGDIDKFQYRIWNGAGTTVIYTSDMTDVANAGTAALTYSGSLLLPGQDYKWDARYQSTLGPISAYGSKKQFRLNGPPSMPTEMFPPQTYVFRDTDTKTFKALFSDPDSATFSDYPISWEIYVEDANENLHDNEVITTSLTSGLNSRTWPGAAFTNGVDYRWRTRFQDSKNAWGAWSPWQSFRVSVPPNGTIIAPSNDSNISSMTPTVTWSYTGGTQRSYKIDIYRTSAEGDIISQETSVEADSEDTSVILPAGFFKDGKYYDITLTVWNTDNLVDPSPSTVNVYVEVDAPDPITGVDSIVNMDKSNITISWNAMALRSGHTFVAYRIYRRRKTLTDWHRAASVLAQGATEYVDWYAGHSVGYQYVVRAVTKKGGVGVQMESADDPSGGSFADTGIESDNWHFIGADRDARHINTLIVTDEGHNRPVQQEVFETLGADRKVIMRGFVLGHEGSLTTLWINSDMIAPEDEQIIINETYQGRRIADYLTRNAGPHIIKSPFGEVWDAQFASPEYTWLPTGHLEITLEFIETGTTSEGEY